MSLKTRLIIIFSLLSIIPLIVFGLISYNLTYSERLSLIKERLVNIASQSEQKINSYFQLIREEFSYTTDDVELRELIASGSTVQSANTGKIKNTLLTQLTEDKMIIGLHVVDTEGNLIASTKDYEIGEKLPYETLITYETDLEQIDLVNYVSNEVNDSILIFSSPIVSDGFQIGTYIAETEPTVLEALTSTYSELGNSGEIVIAKIKDADNLVYLFPLRFDSEAVLSKTISSSNDSIAMNRAMKRMENVHTDNTVDYRGKSVIAATRYIDLSNWGMVVKIDKTEVIAPVLSFQRNLLIFLLIITPIIIFISVLIAGSVTKPISAMTKLSQKIAEGELSQQITINTKDEIGQLGEAFNTMSAKLTQSYGDLEKRVAERTKELETIKSGLETSKSSLEAEVAKRTAELEQAKTGLEAEVAKRTAELNTKLGEIEKMNKYMVGRENRMAELKKKLQDAGIS